MSKIESIATPPSQHLLPLFRGQNHIPDALLNQKPQTILFVLQLDFYDKMRWTLLPSKTGILSYRPRSHDIHCWIRSSQIWRHPCPKTDVFQALGVNSTIFSFKLYSFRCSPCQIRFTAPLFEAITFSFETLSTILVVKVST